MSDPHAELSAEAEAACLAAWPALESIHCDGWLLRFAEGHTRRANSVNPLSPGRLDLATKIATCEAAFAARGLPTVFRIPTTAGSDIDAALTSEGYAPPEGITMVLRMPLPPYGSVPERGSVDLVEWPAREAWLASYVGLTGLGAEAARTTGRILDRLAVPAAFATARTPDGRSGAVVAVMVAGPLAVLNLVVADPALRRRGLARAAAATALEWAATFSGARAACVQVEADNAPAVGLYRGLGFTTELYRYHYRRRRDVTSQALPAAEAPTVSPARPASPRAGRGRG